MAPVLKSLDMDVACYGSHDFDFDEPHLLELTEQTAFTWTLANVVSRHASAPGHLLAAAHEYAVKSVAGCWVGFFGLAGTYWPSNCQHLPECTILDHSTVARRVASYLRRSETAK
ncbi:hypothetical protein RJ55_03748 [Drechmeria coniospora]|nr:hypothetical protein RJ55_03748 [Drechmeria coniospora]